MHRRNNNPRNTILLDCYDETTIFDRESIHLLEDPGKAWNPRYQTLYVDSEGEELIGLSFGSTLKQVTEWNGNRCSIFDITVVEVTLIDGTNKEVSPADFDRNSFYAIPNDKAPCLVTIIIQTLRNDPRVTSEDFSGLLDRHWDKREWQRIYERINCGIATQEEKKMMEDPYENVCGYIMDEQDEIEEMHTYLKMKTRKRGGHMTDGKAQLKASTMAKMIYAFLGDRVLESPEPKKKETPEGPRTAVPRIFMQDNLAAPSVYTAAEETRIKTPKHKLARSKAELNFDIHETACKNCWFHTPLGTTMEHTRDEYCWMARRKVAASPPLRAMVFSLAEQTQGLRYSAARLFNSLDRTERNLV